MSDDAGMLTIGDAYVTLCELAALAHVPRPADKQEAASWLAGRTGREWLILDETARSWSLLGPAPVSGTRGWLDATVDDTDGLVLVVMSWQSDGRIRQRATRELASGDGRLRAAALALRSLDHVAQVRAEALTGLRKRTTEAEATAALAVLVAGRRRQHAQPALDTYLEALSVQHPPAEVFASLRASGDAALRRWAFSYFQRNGALNVRELVDVVLEEPDQFVRAAGAEWLRGRASATQLRMLLAGRYIDGRLLAVHEMPDEDLPDDVLLPLLADPSRRVRELAQWRARRRGLDTAGWYRAQLRQPEPGLGSRRIAGCLDGLGSCGTGDDAELAASFLSDASPAIRAQCVTTVGALAEVSRTRTLLLPLLEDPAGRVSSAAARALSRAGAGPADASRSWTSSRPTTRRAAWWLSRAAGGWASLEADLRAAGDADATLAAQGRASVRNWLRASAATTGGRPSKATASQLATLLPASGLTDHEQRQVAFHARLECPVPATDALILAKPSEPANASASPQPPQPPQPPQLSTSSQPPSPPSPPSPILRRWLRLLPRLRS